MEEMEVFFKKINLLKEYGHFSLDVYFNDIDDTFVVKLQSIIFDKEYPIKHFRNAKLIDSMIGAYNYLLYISYKSGNMKDKIKTVSYTGKSGKRANYKVVAKFATKEGVLRYRLKSYGKQSIEFWVDAGKTEKAVYVSKDTDERRQCWECGCPFSWADAKNNDGDWNDWYCGC